MSFSFRIYFIDEDDKIRRIPQTRFERIHDRDPKELLSEYKNSRIRYAEVIFQLENRKPISIARRQFTGAGRKALYQSALAPAFTAA
ncbi:MAG TPA: hypothetical protein DDW42_01500 [Desulfobacteraceae bacterium]|nr:hypothetical protein [Desulfobacteraceae bacterium]